MTVLEILRSSDTALTHAQIAYHVYGTNVHVGPTGEDTRRRAEAIRKVQQEIERLRRALEPIVPTGAGMKYAKTPQEAQEGAERLDRTADTIRESAAVLRRAAARMDGTEVEQETLWAA